MESAGLLDQSLIYMIAYPLYAYISMPLYLGLQIYVRYVFRIPKKWWTCFAPLAKSTNTTQPSQDLAALFCAIEAIGEAKRTPRLIPETCFPRFKHQTIALDV